MSLINWNRNRELFPNIPSFFENAGWDDDFLSTVWNNRKMPAVNISETKDNFLVEVAAPGMEKKDFHVSVENGMLTISAEKEEKKTEKKKNYRRQEYSFESFERCFRLPENIKTEKVEAKYDNGVLKISLQKAEVVEPKKIEVAVA
ncbi:MAG: Hsp20/alpha crystallin family protein [Saprospiraceae bacterium]|jgi:HSP20 family protein